MFFSGNFYMYVIVESPCYACVCVYAYVFRVIIRTTALSRWKTAFTLERSNILLLGISDSECCSFPSAPQPSLKWILQHPIFVFVVTERHPPDQRAIEFSADYQYVFAKQCLKLNELFFLKIEKKGEKKIKKIQLRKQHT